MMEKKDIHPAIKGMQTSLFGILVNFFLGIIKGLAGVFGNSYALIADAIESFSDVASSFIVWTGLKISTKAPDHDHPYGHGKAEPIATIFVTLFLLIAALTIIIESIKNIFTPHEIPKSYTIWILIFVIIIKEILFKKVLKVGKEINSHAVKSDAWHHRSDAITSMGTLIGISIAIIGGKGYESADDWAALLTSCFIIFNAVQIARPAVSEIMDVAPPASMIEEFKQTAAKEKGVKAIEKCYVRKMGFDYYMDIHVVVDGGITVKEGHDIAHKVKENLLASHPRLQGVIVHIEPFNPLYTQK